MRHMRSRRILAMLLALSMIFGLLTTTAFAGEVDQNTSNVGESAANGTSEVGSGVGQSSGASEGESSKETNKEDVPTGEETTPEEKKTTSSEEVDTQEGEEPTPVETQLTNYVMVGGIAGFEDTKFASFEAAYEAIKPTVATLGLIQESPANAAAFDAVFTDVQDGIATLTYTIAGNITYDETNLDHLLTMGRQSSHYLTNERHLINFKFVGANGDRADTLTINSDITLPYEWWGENTTTSISFEDLTITGSAPNGLYPYQKFFEGIDFTVDNCTLKGIKIYNCANVGGSYTITNSTLNGMGAAANAYAIHLQGHETAPLNITIRDNKISGYDRGINIDQKTAVATISNNEISVNDNGRSCIQLSGLAETTISGNTLALNGGNAFTLHENLRALTAAPEISISGNTITGTGYLIYDDAAANNNAFTADTLNLTYGTNTVDDTVDTTKGVKDSNVVEAGSAVQDAIKGTTSNAVTTSEELADAIANASDGDTIKLAAGEFTTYSNASPKKSLTFVGSGEGTVWTIGDLTKDVHGEGNGDFSFDGCDTITFENMTLKSDGIDYRGFVRISNTIVDDCVLSGKTAYWGYETAKFINSKFNAPEGDYALWDYSSKSMSFDGCEFNISGKGVNVYVEAGNAGSDARKVEVKDCTVTSTKENKAFLNIKNSTQAYDVTISGNNTVNGLAANGTTGSNLYQVEATEITEASGKTVKVEQQKADGTYETVYEVKKQTGVAKGSETNPYTLEELGAMTRAEYIAVQTALGGTMYVSVGDYSYGKDGVLGNGVRNDKPGQTEDRNVLNGYNSNGYLGEKNDGANGLNIVFVNGSITSGVTGYTSIDKIGTSLLLAVPAYTNVTFKGITFHNVMSFDYQLYTGPWSQLGELKFDGCTFNGIIIGATAAQTLTFNSCTFNDYTNTTDANSSNPTWIRPAYGNWKESDNEGQGENFKSLTTINFTNNNVTSTRPVKFEFISQWNKTTTLTATGNTFDISAQDSDTETKNVGLYIGPHTDKNAVDLVLDKNTKSEGTAALYVIPKDMSKLPVGSTVKDSSGTEIEITDALEWKTDTKVTLKTETVPAVKNVAKVGDTDYATLEAAVAAVDDTNNTITLLTDVIQNTQLALNRSLTLNLDGHTIKNENDIWGEKTYCLLRVEDNAVVTITGNGTVAAKKDDCYAISITSGSLTIENGTFIGNISAVQVETGSLTIKDGTFKQIQESKYGNTYVINCIDGEFASGAATVAIYGGTFVGFDPNVSPEKKVDGVTPSFAAPGVGITKNADGTFSAASGMTAQLLDADGNSVKAYDSLADAIAAAEAGQIVRLLANAAENVMIAENKVLTLDLNGFTLTNTEGSHTIVNNGTLTIMDSSAAKSGKVDNVTHARAAIVNYGTMTLAGGTYTRSKECGKTPYDANGNSFYTILNDKGGSLTIKDGVTVTNAGHFSSMICNGNEAVEDTTLTIEGGLFSGGINTIKNGEFGKLTINGGSFTNATQCVVMNWNEASITDGTFELASGVNSTLLFSVSWSEHAIGKMTISGGTFKYTETQGLVQDTYNGGQYSGTLAVSGGTFDCAVDPKYCAEGFEPTKNVDGTYGVKETLAAKIGDTEYETLAAAFAAAKDGDTIVLLKDSSGDGIVVKQSTFTDKGLIVDFNNHSYTVGGVLVGSSGTASNGFQLNKDNKITFKNGALYGDASVAGDETTNWTGAPAIMIQNYSNLTLEKMTVVGGKETCYTISNNCGDTLIKNSTITAGEASTKPAYRPARAFDVCGYSTYTGVSVSVENSTINGNIEISKSNGNTYDATLTLGSGTKVNGSISDGGNGDKVTVTKDTSVNVAAPDGYKWVDGENGQTLAKIVMVAEVNGKQYETLQAAIDAASKNQTVKLIADTTENVTMKTPYLTLDLNGHTLNGGQVKGKPALTVTTRVTVKDSSADMSGTIMREDTEDNSGVSSHYVIDVQGAGWLTFESGNVINDSGTKEGKGASLVRVGNDSVAKQPGLNIKGGSFQQDNFIAIKVDRGNLFLNGGTITSENSYAIENWWNATIKGGTVNGTVSTWVYSDGKAFSDLEISGGTVNGDVASITYDKAEGKTAKVTISGGTVTGTLGTYTYSNGLVPLHDPAKATIGVTGGTFDIDPTPYVVEGSTVKTNSEGKYGVEKAYLAKVGETSYYTMDEAFHAAVASGETLYLLRDYTTNSEQNSGSNSFTIDLNGFTWTYTGTDTNYAAFEINYPNVTLTVKNGTVVSNSMVGLIPSAMGGTITYDNSGLIFESVNATANGHSGIETNGNNTSDTVTLKNSTLNVPNGFGIYFPSSGTLTIDNSQITAKTLGVQVCSGSLDIKGQNAAITVNGDPVPKTENDGAIQDGAAISIVNRAGYKGLGTITVTEGIFKAKSGNAAVKAYNWENKETGEAAFTASDKVAISGGSYSTAVPEDLCAEGFVPVTTPNTDGLYEVKAVEGDAELLDADGTSKGYGYADKLALTATEGQTIKLIKNTTNGGFMLPAGVTLDLNGKTMTSSFLFATGNVIDSTDGTGKLVVGQKNVLFQKNEKYLPLYDGTGYRFFQYQIVTGNLSKESATSVKARLQLKFTNADAYTLLINDSTGAHGMALNLIISWNAIRTQDQNWRIGMPNTVLSSTLNAMRNAGVDPSERFFTLTINGVNVLGSGETLYAKAGLTNRAWPGTSEAAYGSEVSIAID